MRNAATILDIIRERGRRKLPLEGIYRQLYNRDLYLCAYSRLYRNHGAMTPGATDETVDGMALTQQFPVIELERLRASRQEPVERAGRRFPRQRSPRSGSPGATDLSRAPGGDVVANRICSSVGLRG
jgi:hypothetical protein